MPVEIDSDARPGSTLSVSPNSMSNNGNNMVGGINMNAASGSPPPLRPTTTSRRGGRSRSPVSTAPRQPPPNNTAIPGPNESVENPSSAAAAAAAAAAKIYSTSRRGAAHPWQQQQHPSDIGPPTDDGPPTPHRSMYGTGSNAPPAVSSYQPQQHHHHHHQPPQPPPNGWPGDESSANGYRPRGGPTSSAGAYAGYDHPHRGGPAPPYRDDYDRRYHGHHHREPPPPIRYDDSRGRYGGPHRGMPASSYPQSEYHRYGGSSAANGHNIPPPHHASPHHSSRGRPPHSSVSTSQQHRPIQSPPDHRGSRSSYHHRPEQPPPPSTAGHSYATRGNDPSTSASRIDSRNSSGATTTLVLGGTTPIHLPKSPIMSTSASKQQHRSSSSSGASTGPPPSQHRGGSAASVFRGRIDATSPNPTDKDSPENILLSMRTPSTSFEEVKDKSSNKKYKTTTLELDHSPPSKNSQPLFEQQRSTDGIRANGSIDIAPSFPFLLNQSFDSFGDSFNVESTLQADSFGFGRVDSSGNDGTGVQQVLMKNSSDVGNLSAPFLAPSSSGGALTIGYSPVNSFGNASVAPRSNNIMVVGGQDPRSASPTEALGMYRSYSGGTNTTRPLDDSHFRMSIGSFGGQSISAGYNRSSYGGDPTASPGSYYAGPIRSIESSVERIPPFYLLLRKFRRVFRDCTFLLPGVKPLSPSDRHDDDGGGGSHVDQTITSGNPYQLGPVIYGEPSPHDIAIARRRVESSICAFGGNITKEKTAVKSQDDREAIFRDKSESKNHVSVSVTPASTDVSASTQSEIARIRSKYEDALPSRYYENESRLSWEFEENPPVEALPDDDGNTETVEGGRSANKEKQDHTKDDKTATSDDDQYYISIDEADEASADKDGTSPAKMRYRCKLCGQPKQNHTCPYQQALARSIGTMVYPAVNAFTADEPGTIAAPLSEMNNFVDIQKDGSEGSPMRPSPDRLRSSTAGPMTPSAQVTPETTRSSSRQSRSLSGRHGSRKRMYSHYKGSSADHGDLLFVEAMELKPEQFRIVTESKSRKPSEGYVYPALPLPYAQRKRLSDNLFSLSNDVPKLTDECAQVLREAREKDMWDLAVAELMTQVIVIIHCNERDYRFEGLRQYLLTLGIAC